MAKHTLVSFAALLICILILTSSMEVFAKGGKQQNVVLPPSATGGYGSSSVAMPNAGAPTLQSPGILLPGNLVLPPEPVMAAPAHARTANKNSTRNKD